MPRKKHYQWHAGNDGAAPADLPPSRSAKKRQSHALQGLGEELTRLGPQEVRSLNLPPDLTEALDMYSRIREHEARRRQLQYIGRLMRDVDPEPLRAALDARKGRDAAATAALHLAEQWRDRLLDVPEGELPALLASLPGRGRAGDGSGDGSADDSAGATGERPAPPAPTPEELRELALKARKELAEQRAPHARRALFRALHRLLAP